MYVTYPVSIQLNRLPQNRAKWRTSNWYLAERKQFCLYSGIIVWKWKTSKITSSCSTLPNFRIHMQGAYSIFCIQIIIVNRKQWKEFSMDEFLSVVLWKQEFGNRDESILMEVFQIFGLPKFLGMKLIQSLFSQTDLHT